MNATLKSLNAILAARPIAADGSEEIDIWTVWVDGKEIVLGAPLDTAVVIEEQGFAIKAHPSLVNITKLHHFTGWLVQHDDGQWSQLEAVKPHPAQGWAVHLAGGVKLQSCFVTGVWTVREK